MQRHAKSGLFLLEMIISIAFFAFCSAVCIGLFAEARITSAHTREVNMAVITAQTAAESFKAANGVVDEAAAILDGEVVNGELYINYDENWQKTQTLSSYRVHVYVDMEASPVKADIAVMSVDAGEIIHSIKVEKYRP